MSDTVRSTQVAIIGGGIMGVAAQFQLAENGWTDSILFEKAELTSGSTWHSTTYPPTASMRPSGLTEPAPLRGPRRSAPVGIT